MFLTHTSTISCYLTLLQNSQYSQTSLSEINTQRQKQYAVCFYFPGCVPVSIYSYVLWPQHAYTSFPARLSECPGVETVQQLRLFLPNSDTAQWDLRADRQQVTLWDMCVQLSSQEVWVRWEA